MFNLNVLGYMLSSAVLVVLNKVALALVRDSVLLLFVQLSVSALFLYIANRNGIRSPSFDLIKGFWLVPALFFILLFSNTKLLQHTNVETFIVIRTFAPIQVSLVESGFLDRKRLEIRSYLVILCIILLTCAYVHVEGKQFTTSSVTWIVVWMTLLCIDQVYVKHVVEVTDLSVPEMAFYNNFLPLPFIALGFLQWSKLAEINTHGWGILFLSSLVGVALSYFGFETRRHFSATIFTVIGNVCKLLSVLINFIIWDNHASYLGVFILVSCIALSVFIKEAPLGTTNETTKYVSRGFFLINMGLFAAVVHSIYTVPTFYGPLVSEKFDVFDYPNFEDSLSIPDLTVGFGPVVLPACGPVNYTLVYSETPDWVYNPGSTLIYKNTKVIAPPVHMTPGMAQTGIGLAPLQGGGFITFFRMFDLRYFSEKEPHMCAQTMGVYDPYFNFDNTKTCMFSLGADVRIFNHRGTPWGYTILQEKYKTNLQTNTLLYRADTAEVFVLLIDGMDTWDKQGKNWMPFTYQRDLYFVHSLAPELIIIRVDTENVIGKINTFQGTLSVIRGYIHCKTHSFNSVPLKHRGSTPAIVSRTGTVWGIGHHSFYGKDAGQIPFFWSFSMKHTDSGVRIIAMKTFDYRPRYTFPISLFTHENRVFFTATISEQNWFNRNLRNVQFPVTQIQNTLMELYVESN